MMTGSRRLPLAVTMGEPAGIGGEITLKAWRARDKSSPCFFVIDSVGRLSELSDRLGLDCKVEELSDPAECAGVFKNALPVLTLKNAVAAAPGRPDGANAPAVIESIDRAIGLAMDGKAGAVVTNPIHKETLYGAGFDYPGHTEYLADKAGDGCSVMMIASDKLRVVPVTIHLSLADALARLDEQAILYCVRTANDALRKNFGLEKPRIVVAGLNPHAGEGGHLGMQETEIIAPAIAALQREGIAVTGPRAADSLFHDAARRDYDLAVCMYHDQALIPAKTLAFDDGVNVTLGLSIIRTSPDHGTAFDIAGTGAANPQSLVAALNLAARMAGSGK